MSLKNEILEISSKIYSLIHHNDLVDVADLIKQRHEMIVQFVNQLFDAEKEDSLGEFALLDENAVLALQQERLHTQKSLAGYGRLKDYLVT